MFSDNYIVPEITWLFLRIFKGTVFSEPVVHWLGQKPGKSPKKAQIQLASGRLFKVDHWLGQKPGKRHQKGQNPVS